MPLSIHRTTAGYSLRAVASSLQATPYQSQPRGSLIMDAEGPFRTSVSTLDGSQSEEHLHISQTLVGPSTQMVYFATFGRIYVPDMHLRLRVSSILTRSPLGSIVGQTNSSPSPPTHYGLTSELCQRLLQSCTDLSPRQTCAPQNLMDFSSNFRFTRSLVIPISNDFIESSHSSSGYTSILVIVIISQAVHSSSDS